jgi:DNA-binding CsgD family transcriptional regulator
MLDTVRSGHGHGAVVIEGAAGSGKTRMLAELNRAAADAGFAVLLAPDATELERLVADAVATASAARPLLITVDDVNAASAGQAVALCALADRIGGRPVALAVVCERAGGRLVNLGAAEHVTLSPLPEDAVIEITRDLLGATPDATLRECVAAAEGNPGLLTEFVLGLCEDGHIEVDGDVACLAHDEIPLRLIALAADRLDELSPDCRQLLRVGAVLGRGFSFEHVVGMLHSTASALLQPLDEALRSGLVRATDETFTYTDKLVWRAVLRTIAPPVLRLMRQEAQATREATSGAAAVLAAWSPTSVSLQIMGGQAEEAVRASEHVLRRHDVTAGMRQEAVAAQLLGLSLRDEARAGHQAREILARDLPHSDVDSLMAAMVVSNLRWSAADMAEGLRLGWRAVDEGRGAVHPMWRLHHVLPLARKLANVGDFAAAEALLDEIDENVRLAGEARTAASPIVRASVLLQAGRLSEARQQAHHALSSMDLLATPLLEPFGHAVLATVAELTGDLLAGMRHVARLESGSTGQALPSTQYAWAVVRVTAAKSGPRAAADLVLNRHPELITGDALFVEEPGAAAWLVRLGTATGVGELADQAVLAAERVAAANPGFSGAVAAGRHARGLRAGDLDALEEAATGHRVPWARACAAEDLGVGLAGVRSRSAADWLLAAVREFDRMGAQRDGARVRRHLRELGRPVPAVPRQRDRNTESASLSGSELSIAYLVAEGLTNSQIASRVFLSPHTVNYHLRQVFRKLDIGSRSELATLVRGWADVDRLDHPTMRGA